MELPGGFNAPPQVSALEMSSPDFVDLCSDEETERQNAKPDFTRNLVKKEVIYSLRNGHFESQVHALAHTLQDNTSSHEVLPSFSASNTHVLPDTTPLCQQFWKAGDFESRLTSRSIPQNGQNRLRIHPRFLHSNATSHKWAFGAIAELLDNAVDEVQNGATFVIVDKFTDPRNGHNALLIQDDGGGMDPESLHSCMSFGFSDKQSDSFIGQYGNGFKTSTMRLGADVIVFSRCMRKRTLTQSIGLLSYTFLRHTGSIDIVVPMVDYEFDSVNGQFEMVFRNGSRQVALNLSVIVKWSPFATENELLQQFENLGHHGTKIIVFNLWLNDDGYTELDFEHDPEDILVSGAPKLEQTDNSKKMLNQKHIANRFRHSLRVYLSILYLHLPEKFTIILCGRVVQPHYIVHDLKYAEGIKYRPQDGRGSEVITFIGFLEGAPTLTSHGFNIYHKNRLILPFLPVVSSSKGKGVAGVLEANFIKPTHDKQDFEKSNIYKKLETRLKDMTVEYWDCHCHFVGCSTSRRLPLEPALPATLVNHPHFGNFNGTNRPTACNGAQDDFRHQTSSLSRAGGAVTCSGTSQDSVVNPQHQSASHHVVPALRAPAHLAPREKFPTDCNAMSQPGLQKKRRSEGHIVSALATKSPSLESGVAAGLGIIQRGQHSQAGEERPLQELNTILEENKKLHTECSKYEKSVKELELKVEELQKELQAAQHAFKTSMIELRLMDDIKVKL